jgi:hypothetical protein
MSNSPLSDDPEFQAATQALGHTLNDNHFALAGDRLRRHMESALQIEAAQPARPIIIGQIGVLDVTHGWIARLAENPDATMRVEDAIGEIQAAILAGLRSVQL